MLNVHWWSFDHLLREVGRQEEKCLAEAEKAFLAKPLKHSVVFRKSEQIPRAIHFSVYNWSAKQLDSPQEF